MVENIENLPPPEAPEYPPENAFDVEAFTGRALDALKKHWPVLLGPAGIAVDIAKSKGKGDADLFVMLGELVLAAEKYGFQFLVPILKAVIEAVGILMAPGMDALGALTGVYVDQLVAGQGKVQRTTGKDVIPDNESPAGKAFDKILAPLAGLYGAENPARTGAGEKNSQFALGSIVNIHLATWMVNIISNITGMGTLKWINSFDEAITSALNSRALGRIAMRPYLTKFMAEPLNRDLNKRLPLDLGSPSALIKAYIRGGLSREALIDKLRGKGYDESVCEQLLLDNIKMISTEAVAWLVNRDIWSEDQALEYLEQQGYPAMLAPVILALERTSLQRTVWRGIASDVVSAMGNHQIDNLMARKILSNSDLTEDEVNAYITRGALQAETPKRISYSQVRQLYAESLIDLDYVLQWLKDEQYGDHEADLLVLLEFTKHEDRVQRASELAERRRVAEDDRRKAKVLLEISQAQRAAKYGIPWPPP